MDRAIALDPEEPFGKPPHDTRARLLKRIVLKGCNIHDRQTMIVQAIDLGALAGRSSGQAGPDFSHSFIERFRPLKTRVPECDIADTLLAPPAYPGGGTIRAGPAGSGAGS